MHESSVSPLVRIGAGATTNVTPESAADHAADLCLETFGDEHPDLLLAFATEAHAPEFAPLCARLRARMRPGSFLGIIGAGAISGRGAVESGHGLSILALKTAHGRVALGVSESLDDSLADVLVHDERRVSFLFATDEHLGLESLLTNIDSRSGPRRAPVLGSVVKAATSARPAMIADDRALSSGVSAVSLSGDFHFDAWVSQGCVAFGPTMVVTRAQGDQILELSGVPAVEAIHNALESLPENRRKLIAGGVFIGRVVSEYKEHFGRDDFLIRQILRVNTEIGAISVAEPFRIGQTVRLHARDAAAALSDLTMVLGMQRLRGQAVGALMFSSSGRGEAMHGSSPHEAGAVSRVLAPPQAGEQLAKAGRRIDPASRPAVPMAGLFGSMEIGPVGSGETLRSRVHAQSTVLGVFRAL